MSITYIVGDATEPQATGKRIIVHICNDVGAWGKGFVLALSKKWKEPEYHYREWFKSKDGFELGAVQFVQVEENTWIANVIGQQGLFKSGKSPPIRYDAVQSGLENVASFAKEHSASVHMPRIGCGLAGGKWEMIEPLIVTELIEKSISVTVYDFNCVLSHAI